MEISPESQSQLDNMDPVLLNDLQFLLKDVLAGDPDAIGNPLFSGLNITQIKTALDFVLTNPSLSIEDKGELLANSWRINYRDKPPTPEEFLTEKYLGPTATTLYPHVKKAFIDFLDPTKPYRTIVLYPYIGFGKSFEAVLINLYIGVHLSMMRNPWKFFGQSPGTVYTQVFCAASLKKSSELLFEPMLQMLESASFFEKVHTREAMLHRDRDFERMENIDRIFWTTATPTSALQFSSGANFKLISSPNGLLGQTIVSGTMTEITFFKEAGKPDEFVFRFFTKLRARIESRMKGNYFGRFILDSSPNTLESPIDDWIVHDAPKNPMNYIVKGARWDYAKKDFPADTFDEHGRVRPEKAFPVFVGGKGRPPMLIEPVQRKLYSPEDIIDVPNTPLMKGIFEENVFEALKDQAGIPAGSSDKIFYDQSKIDNIFEPKLRNMYVHISASSKDSPEDLIWTQIRDLFFIKYVNKYQFWYKPHLARTLSVDQSISGDVTAISAAHVEKDKLTGSSMYIVDFTIVITPAGGRINLDAIRYFIEDLRDKGGMKIIHGSFDNFQSEAAFQYLLRRGFDIEKLSVDKTMDPYLNFISVIESGRLRAGKNLHFKNNLRSLQIVKRKNTSTPKVDHTLGDLVLDGDTNWDTSRIGTYAKDVADSVCGAIELLRKYDVFPFELWDSMAIKDKSETDARNSVEEFLKNQGLSSG